MFFGFDFVFSFCVLFLRGSLNFLWFGSYFLGSAITNAAFRRVFRKRPSAPTAKGRKGDTKEDSASVSRITIALRSSQSNGQHKKNHQPAFLRPNLGLSKCESFAHTTGKQ